MGVCVFPGSKYNSAYCFILMQDNFQKTENLKFSLVQCLKTSLQDSLLPLPGDAPDSCTTVNYQTAFMTTLKHPNCFGKSHFKMVCCLWISHTLSFRIDKRQEKELTPNKNINDAGKREIFSLGCIQGSHCIS